MTKTGMIKINLQFGKCVLIVNVAARAELLLKCLLIFLRDYEAMKFQYCEKCLVFYFSLFIYRN